MIDTVTAKTSIDTDLLTSFGFTNENGVLSLSRTIAGGQLTVCFSISEGNLNYRVIDSFDCEEYLLHLSPNADGAFVNLVRSEIDALLSDIICNCSKSGLSRTEQMEDVIKYCMSRYGDSFEYLWDNLPDAAAVRRADNRKWYGVLMKIPSEKLGILPSRDVSVINLHVDSGELESLVKRDGIFPAYHMSKKHWVTVLLDGSVKTDDIFSMIDKSYELGGKKLKKRTSPSHSST